MTNDADTTTPPLVGNPARLETDTLSALVADADLVVGVAGGVAASQEVLVPA